MVVGVVVDVIVILNCEIWVFKPLLVLQDVKPSTLTLRSRPRSTCTSTATKTFTNSLVCPEFFSFVTVEVIVVVDVHVDVIGFCFGWGYSHCVDVLPVSPW